MTNELTAVTEDVHALGCDDVDRTEGYENGASVVVALPEEHRREPRGECSGSFRECTATPATPTSCPTTSGRRSRDG